MNTETQSPLAIGQSLVSSICRWSAGNTTIHGEIQAVYFRPVMKTGQLLEYVGPMLLVRVTNPLQDHGRLVEMHFKDVIIRS